MKEGEACTKNNDCRVDLKNLPFKWDRFYIISENHFPEVQNEEDISTLINSEYNGDIKNNERLLVFIFKDKIVRKIIDNYKKEKLIDSKSLPVDFYIDHSIPPYFENNNAIFLIRKNENTYTLYWVNNNR
ncbi:hypothetical protein PFY12_14390 [Chryseobacterium camelliae]|uniref:Uncharacterized protein n=1 Tax=Chryseobacterium camelliae TaxID=1265445 RepID=A0ABY7QKL2_9FLAO|nr:hypothetical protein [Chryseobacterium camelliae]WBV60213.1 hypothetical protein PFY12_14390 [Chryseobacterium camelliae]